MKDDHLELMQRRDEWELDSRDVILGVELGQGAFGLVLTGFYQNKQIAIKVLKGRYSTSRDRDQRMLRTKANIIARSATGNRGAISNCFNSSREKTTIRLIEG